MKILIFGASDMIGQRILREVWASVPAYLSTHLFQRNIKRLSLHEQ